MTDRAAPNDQLERTVTRYRVRVSNGAHMRSPKVILIGGSSHAGKTTLGGALARAGSRHFYSSDQLARHPGRPWPGAGGRPVRPHVEDYYLRLDAEQQLREVLDHYRVNVLPRVREIVQLHTLGAAAEPAVLEGSALWPEFVRELLSRGDVGAIWLTASDELFRERIYRDSEYEQASEPQRQLIDRFLLRTWAYNRRLEGTLEQLKLPYIRVDGTTPDELADVVAHHLEAAP